MRPLSWPIMSAGAASSNELAHCTVPCSRSKNLSGHKPSEIVIESSMLSTRTISTASCKDFHFCKNSCAAEVRSSKDLWFLGALVLKGQESLAWASHKYMKTTGHGSWRRIRCSSVSISFARNGGQDDVDATSKARGMFRMSCISTTPPSPSTRCAVPVNFFPATSARGWNNLSLARKKKMSERCSRGTLEAASR